MSENHSWLLIKPLGEGGQSEVVLVRSPARVADQEKCLEKIRTALDGDNRKQLAEAIYSYARPDSPSELGAMKIFSKTRDWGAPAEQRFKSEITILRQNRPNLPKLLDANEAERWLVTEYFPEGTLERSLSRYKGDVAAVLRAFRSLVVVARSLHKDKIVHRDIKPANVFVGADGALVLGDFGIAYLPEQAPRITITNERVGPWEYMPQWGDWGERLEKVEPNFDVYMLGKLLWCMVSGRLRLPREYHRRPEFDLEVIFPNDWRMNVINSILDKCLVEEPAQCLASAEQLLAVVDEGLTNIESGAQLRVRNGKVELPCRVCGKGVCRDQTPDGSVRLTVMDSMGRGVSTINARVFTCSVCTHFELFAPNYPDEGAARGWK